MTNQGQRNETKDRDRSEAIREPRDATAEFSRLLEGRRWEAQDGPFRGFESPPGRF